MAKFSYLCLFLGCASLLPIASVCPYFVYDDVERFPDYYVPRTNPVGINLGPDFMTAAVSTGDSHCAKTLSDVGEWELVAANTRFLVQREGDHLYKSFMRQGLFNDIVIPERNKGALAPSATAPESVDNSHDNFDPTLQLPLIFPRPADSEFLLSIFSDLKASIDRTLGRDVAWEGVLVSLPSSVSGDTRDELEKQLKAAGFNQAITAITPYVVNQPETMTTPDTVSMGLECGHDKKDVLVVELNGAALEITLNEVGYGSADTRAYEARPDLGEDVFALEFTRPMDEVEKPDCLNSTALTAAKSRLREVRGRNHQTVFPRVDHINGLNLNHDLIDSLEKQRFKAIQEALENFVININQENHTGSRESAVSLDAVRVLLSGDASRSDFTMLKKTILDSDVLSGLDLSFLDNRDIAPIREAAVATARLGVLQEMLFCGSFP